MNVYINNSVTNSGNQLRSFSDTGYIIFPFETFRNVLITLVNSKVKNMAASMKTTCDKLLL